MNKRTISRRIVQILALVGSAGSCWMSGVFGYEVAKYSPAAQGSSTGDYIPMLTTYVLERMHMLPTLGAVVAAGIVLAVVVAFMFSRDEDTRLQITLWAVAIGYSAAVQVWMFVGVALVVLPNAAKGI